MNEEEQEEKSTARFGRYNLLEHLAKGGMAQIYKASTPQGKVFTLKKILQDYSNNPDFIKMFLEEAKISLNLKHPHIVRVLDFGQVDGTYYLAMEYVFGRDLGTLLRTSVEKRIFIPIDVACWIIWQCCKALEYAHGLVDSFGKLTSIIHRDISPPNILVSFNGEAKIVDFGIAKAAKASNRQNTRSGVLKGKFSYMSPEQASGQNLSPASDQFSIGIVLWELLTSRSLFFSQDEIETLERVRKADVPRPSKLRKDLPKDLEEIVLKALSKKEKDRFASCGQFAEAIKQFLKSNYPRTDARSVAKFFRACFPDDFQKRAKVSAREGWVDILVSGGVDEDLMIDRSFSDADQMRSFSPTHEERIGFFQRLLYDPRTNLKLVKNLTRAGLLSLCLAAVSWAWWSGALKNLSEKGLSVLLTQNEENKSAVDLGTPVTQKLDANISQLGFQELIQVAQEAQLKSDFDKMASAVQRASEINPLDTRLIILKNFLNIATGDFETACLELKTNSQIPAIEKLLGEAICAEIQADFNRAFGFYRDFLTQYPQDSRVGLVRSAIEYVKRELRGKVQ